MSIIFDDGPDESYCDSCDALLYERKDGSMVCSNSNCGREYLYKSVNKHHRNLQPIESPYDMQGPEIVPMTNYGITTRKKESVLDKEDKRWVSKGSGRSITNVDEYLPDKTTS